MLPVFLSCSCTRYAAHFNTVGAAFHTTAWVNAPRFSAVGVGVMLPIFPLLMPPFGLRRGEILPVFSDVGVGVMLPYFLLLVQPFTLRRG